MTQTTNKIATSEDINLCYFGGSGGFLCLYLILLSKRHCCSFGPAYDSISWDNLLQMLWQHQFGVKEIEHWKHNEHWPKNEITASFSGPKVFFHCNDHRGELYTGAPSLLIYTDIDTHMELSQRKVVGRFQQHSIQDLANESFVIMYNNVKDSSWPELTNMQNFVKLEKRIQQELIENYNAERYLDIKQFKQFFNDQQSYYNQQLGCRVFHEIEQNWDLYTHHMDLKNIVKTQGKSLTDMFDLPYTVDHERLFDRWFSLHDYNLKQLLTSEQ